MNIWTVVSACAPQRDENVRSTGGCPKDVWSYPLDVS